MTAVMIGIFIFILVSMIWYEAGYRRGKDEMRNTAHSIYSMYLNDKDRLNGDNTKNK